MTTFIFIITLFAIIGVIVEIVAICTRSKLLYTIFLVQASFICAAYLIAGELFTGSIWASTVFFWCLQESKYDQ